MSTNNQLPVLLNVSLAEGKNHCDIQADITGYYADEVRVTPSDNSLIVDMSTRVDPGKSYYLGELEGESYRRVIPLNFAFNPHTVMTHHQNGKLSINLVKTVDQSSTIKDSVAA